MPPSGKPRETRSNTRASRQQAKAQATASTWEQVAARYPPNIVSLVEGLGNGEMTLIDLLRLELLDYFRLDGQIAKYFSEARSGTTVSALQSVRLQSRKHMRQILAMAGPALTLGDQPVRVPEGMTRADFESLRREIEAEPDEIMS